jgi:adhesin transport system outer membrane protein
LGLIQTNILAACFLSVFVGGATGETIKQAVQAAVTTNPSIRATSAEMQAAAYDLMSLRGEYEPTVTVYGDAGYEFVDDPADLSPADNNNTKFTRQIGFVTEVVLFDGFRRANTVYSAAAQVDGSIFRLLDASETMALNAVEAYIDVYRHRQLVAVSDRNVERHREIGEQVKALVDGGRLPVSDGLQIEDRINAAILARLEVQLALKDAEARYTRVVGHAPSGSMAIPLAPGPKSLQDLITQSVANSYRMQYAQTQIDQSKYDREIYKSDLQPRISLGAGMSAGQNRGGSSGSENDGNIGLRLNWTLYKGGRKEELNALGQRSYAAQAERDLTYREVQELATRTWNSYQNNAQRAVQLDTQLAVNQLMVTQFTEEFRAAKRSLLDMLEVERARYNVEFQKVSADASRAFSSYRVLAAQSKLANYFGLKKSDIALVPNYQSRALVKPTSVFNTRVEKLE